MPELRGLVPAYQLRRSLGLPGALKRIAYNVAWMKVDPLWNAIIRAGLMPYATRIFQGVLGLNTRPATIAHPDIETSSDPTRKLLVTQPFSESSSAPSPAG